MAEELKPISNIKFPSLIDFSRDGLIDAIIERIKEDPNWNEKWDGELYQNASFMILNYFAYMFESGMMDMNKALRENFLSEAINENNIATHLFDNNIKIRQNTAAAVDLEGTIITAFDFKRDIIITPLEEVPGTGLDGETLTFEIFNINSTTGKPEYKQNVIVETSSLLNQVITVPAYSGTTSVKEVFLDASNMESFSITLDLPDTIENSIRIYYEENTDKQTELLESDSFSVPFIDIPANLTTEFTNGVPRWIVRYDDNGTATIIFSSENFGGAFSTPENKKLSIYYRTGGGINSNVNKFALNARKTIFLTNQNSVDISFTNVDPAFNGQDRESTVEVQEFAPYRRNRDQTLVHDNDAILFFSGKVEKYKVSSPRLNEPFNTVPNNHVFHYIAPLRDLENFTLPIPLATETVETYKVRFEEALNSFLILTGINDDPVISKFVTDFVNNTAETLPYDFTELLNPKNPLNGTLTLEAYNALGRQIDELKFSENFNITGVTNPTPLTSNASILTRVVNTDNPYNPSGGVNDSFSFNFDNVGNAINISVSDAFIYTTAEFLASQIDAAIKTELQSVDGAYFLANQNFTFAEASGEQVIIKTATTGELGKLVVLTANANTELELTEGVYRPIPESGLVFKNTSTFEYSTSTVNYEINTNNHAQSTDFAITDEDIALPNPAELTGATTTKIILEENDELPTLLQLDSNLRIEAYDTLDNLLDAAEFFVVRDVDDNQGVSDVDVSGSTNNIFKTAGHLYDYDDATIQLKLTDGVSNDEIADDQFSQDLTSLSSSPALVEEGLFVTYIDTVETIPDSSKTQDIDFTLTTTLTDIGTTLTNSIDNTTVELYVYNPGDTETKVGDVTLNAGSLYDFLENPLSGDFVFQGTNTIDIDTGELALDFNWTDEVNPSVVLKYQYKEEVEQTLGVIVDTGGINDQFIFSGTISPESGIVPSTAQLFIGGTLVTTDGGGGTFPPGSLDILTTGAINYVTGQLDLNFIEDVSQNEIVKIKYQRLVSVEVDLMANASTSVTINTTVSHVITTDIKSGLKRGTIDLLTDGITQATDDGTVTGDGALVTAGNSGFTLNSSTVEYNKSSFPSGSATIAINYVYVNPTPATAPTIALDFTYKQPNSQNITFQFDETTYSTNILDDGTEDDNLFTQLENIINNDATHPRYNETDLWSGFTTYSEAFAYAAKKEMSGVEDHLTADNTTFAPKELLKAVSTEDGFDSVINIPELKVGTNGFLIFPETFADGDVGDTYTPNDDVKSVAKITVIYSRKNYEYISVSYTPDPYFPTDEAKQYQDMLMASDKRMNVVQHLIKNVTFIPVKVDGNIIVSQGSFPVDIEEASRELMFENFGYSNTVIENKIGGGYNLNKMIEIVSDTTLNPGYRSSTFTVNASNQTAASSNNIADSSDDRDQYYFILDEELIDRLEELEEDYPQVLGIKDEYDISLLVEVEE